MINCGAPTCDQEIVFMRLLLACRTLTFTTFELIRPMFSWLDLAKGDA